MWYQHIVISESPSCVRGSAKASKFAEATAEELEWSAEDFVPIVTDLSALARRAVETANARGKRNTTVYDNAGQVVASIEPLGFRTSQAYDAAGRQVRVQNALGKISSTMYDSAGQVTASINPLGKRTS